MTSTRRYGWLLVLAAVGLLVLLVVKSCSIPSTYFRVTAHLMHHDEPVTLDWVVECRYQQNVGDAVGARAFVVPYVFGVATRDGGMVLMAAPNACGQQKEVRDNLPFFMWGDKAGDFGFFTAYVTREAFDNPSTQIKVLDVDIRPSDRAEHDRWAATAPKNVVPDHPDPFRHDQTERSSQCVGFVKVPIPASFTDEVGRLRPAETARYWIAPEAIGIKIAEQAHSFLADRGTESITEGIGLDAFYRQHPIRIFPFGNRNYFYRRFVRPDYNSISDTTYVKVDLDRPGMMSCAAITRGFFPHGFTVLDFPDGTSPPLRVKTLAIEDAAVISDDNYLFLQTLIYFDVERGLEDHD